MWKNFDPTPYDATGFLAHVAALDFSAWETDPHARSKRPLFIVLHNTSAPTLAQWVEMGPAHDARLHNLQNYYEGMGWHAGPHYFVSRAHINGFSDPVRPGVHASCFNGVSIGIEMAGEYNVEAFDSGDGAQVRDMAVLALAALHNKLGLEPLPFSHGVCGLHFHRDCVQDHHDCPGSNVHRDDVIARVQAKMAELKAQAPSA